MLVKETKQYGGIRDEFREERRKDKLRKEGWIMKKLVVLAVIAMAVPAMASNLTITGSSLGSGWVAINYTADANVSAIALDINDVNSGSTITAISDYFKGECTSGSKGHGIFPGNFHRYIDANSPNWSDANYTPVAHSDDLGSPLPGLGSHGITTEQGALYTVGNAPAKSGTLFKIQVTGLPAKLIVSGNSARGGAVAEGGTTMTLTGATIVVPAPSAGWWYPPCWDSATQCHGDVDNDADVDTVDWPTFRNGFGKDYPAANYVTNACGDLNHDGHIDTIDWPLFRTSFGKSVAADCSPLGDFNHVFESYVP